MDIDKSTAYLEYILNRFYPIGDDGNHGVTRLGYTKEEDLMHEEFKELGVEEGYIVEIDQVGNTFLSINENKEYYLVGSHLDSVINGGRFDGVLGVAAGLLLLKIIKEEKLSIPLKVVALRCEESSNFMKSTIGSGLITGENKPEDYNNLVSRTGKTLESIFIERGYEKKPNLVQGIKAYLELHIEQGRILENEGLNIGLVSAIAGNTRFKINLKGLAEHSGATPMLIRQDALCCASEIILGVERIGQGDFKTSAVTTVGMIKNFPNSLNVIPGEVEFTVDIRDIDNDNIKRIQKEIYQLVQDVSNKRKIGYRIDFLSSASAIHLHDELREELIGIANRFNIKHKVMPSGAGHDAMKFTNITKSAMIFVPCRRGISHNPEEYADLQDAVLGTKIMLEYLSGGTNWEI